MATGGADLLNTVVIGATGATGKCLVGSLLKAKDKVAKVTILTRRKLEAVGQEYGVDIGVEETAGRLTQHVEDLNDISDDTVKQLCTGSHVFFNCLGTSRRQAGSADAFRHIDYEIPIRLIKLAHQAGVPHCSLLTSFGSNPNSWFLYLRTKGEMENSVKGLEFSYTSIFRPGVLERGGSARFGEKVIKFFFTPMPVATLAEGMMQDAWNYFSGGGNSASADKVIVLGNSDIRRLSEEGRGPKVATEEPKSEESKDEQPEPPKEEQPEQPKEKRTEHPKEETEQSEEERTGQPKEEEPEQPKEEETEQPKEEETEQPEAKEEQPKEEQTEQVKEEEHPKVEEQSSEEPPKEEQAT